MNRNQIAGALIALTVLGAATNAVASTDQAGISFRIGTALPTDRVAKNEGDYYIAYGVDYKLADIKMKGLEGYKSSLSLSFDYYGKGDVRNIPVLVNYVGKVGALYYTAGVGVGFTQIPEDNKTRVAYGAGVGYEFGSQSENPVFVEAKFLGTTEPKVNAFGIYFGIRF